jgi:hypothetical protein
MMMNISLYIALLAPENTGKGFGFCVCGPQTTLGGG